MHSALLLLALFLLAGGCQPLTAPSPPSPLPSPPPSASPTPAATHAVSVHIQSVAKTYAGTTAHVIITFNPVNYRVALKPDGSVAYSSESPWTNHDVSEMRACAGPGEPCPLPEGWVPFVPRQEYTLDVNWLGPRMFWVVAQFRSASGEIVPSIGDAYQVPQPLGQDSIQIVGLFAEATPLAGQPPAIQTAVAATRTAFPVTGSVKIKGSPCCVGGKAGSRIPIEVTFQASSPFAPVAEMRTADHCATEAEMAGVPWEPFTATRTYTTVAAINFVGWYIAAQYRDAQGNLSPVYCDDISVEGSP